MKLDGKALLVSTITLLAASFAAPAWGAPLAATPKLGAASALGDEHPDKRPEIKEALARLKSHISKRGEQDHDAIALIDSVLMKEFPESGPKDRAAIVKALGACFKVKRKTSKEGIRDNKLYLAVAVALGTMGPESSKELQSWINHKSHRRDLVLQRMLILSLGKVRDPKAVKYLVDLLKHQAPEVQAAAAEALANYDEADQKVRKDIFEEVLKILGGAKTQVDQDVNDTVARERYDIIEGSMITTLQVMSGNDLRDPGQWQHWWNKNKRRDWDEAG